MKKQWHALIAALIIIIMACSSLPEHNELSWYSKYTVPVVNNAFYIKDLLKSITVDSNFFITDPDTGSSNLGDTFTIHITKSDLKENESLLFNSNLLNLNYKFSQLFTSDLPKLYDTLNLLLPKDSLNSEVYFDGQVVSNFFKKLEIDTFNSDIKIKVINLTEGIEFQDGLLTINGLNQKSISKNFSLKETSIDTVLILESGDIELIDSINYELLVKYEKSEHEIQKMKIVLEFDFNGLSIKSAEIDDNYLNYSFEQELFLPVSVDGFYLYFLDFEKLEISGIIKNPFAFSLNSKILFNSLNNADSSNGEDSSYCLNLNIEANDKNGSFKESCFNIDFNKKRLTAFWDSSNQICYIPVLFSGCINASGNTVSINKDMEIGVSVDNPEVKVTELKGSYECTTFIEGKPDDFDMPLTELKDVLVAIRDKVKLTNNKLLVNLEFLMPESSLISDVTYWCIMMMYSDTEMVEDTLSWSMKDIKGKHYYQYEFEVNKMVNAFPDSIKYRIDYQFPKGTQIHLHDSLFQNADGKSSVIMNVNFDLELVSSLVWEINSDVCLDLGIINIPLNMLASSQAAVLKEKVFFTEFEILNNTNFRGLFFGLASKMENRSFLEEIKPDSFVNYFDNYSGDALYIPILGEDGIELPRRGDKKIDVRYLDNLNIAKVLQSDSIAVRFGVIVSPTTSDALIDTDFISINASATLEGVQSTDDLPIH